MLWCSCWPGLQILVGRQHIDPSHQPLAFFVNDHLQLCAICADFMEGNPPLRGLSWARQACCGVPAGLDCKPWWVDSTLAAGLTRYHFMEMNIRSFALISWKATSHSEGSAGPDSHAVVFLLAWTANPGG